MRRRIPSTQTLMCFEAAARHQSFTRAAQELALTQGAVSRQVGVLEESVGVALFRRTRHGMSLTPAGQQYARRVRQRLDALERDTLDLMGTRGERESLVLACLPTFSTRWLIPRLPDLARVHPGLQVHIDARSRPFLFADTEADAAIFAGTPEQMRQWAGTQAVPLIAEEVVAVCSPALRGRRRLQPHEVAQLPLLQQSTRPDAWRTWFDAHGVDAPDAMAGPRYELFSMGAAAAASGLGVALIPRLLISAELERGTLVIACGEAVHSGRTYYLVSPEPAMRPVVQDLCEWLVASAGRAV